LGDGVMLVCVDTRPLLEAILELHHVVTEVSEPAERVSIRSGVTSGEVILMEGDDYVGHCVNVAARLCDLAASGEALADPSVIDLLPNWGIAHEETHVTLRGVEKPVPASSIRMLWVDGDSERDPICGLPMTHETAEEIAHDAKGSTVLFCSPACVDTWRRRPRGRVPAEAPRA
jgi:YHS domain-containing protein